MGKGKVNPDSQKGQRLPVGIRVKKGGNDKANRPRGHSRGTTNLNPNHNGGAIRREKMHLTPTAFLSDLMG